MRVLAGAGVWGTGRVVTHTGLGWMGGLVLRMVLAFNVAEPGRTERKTNIFRRQDLSETPTAEFDAFPTSASLNCVAL